ncbi:MAG: dihydroorotate dehydrogenase electron transfer subunit [Clostridia bacterium]|nr:dihydroorotate dehydrogenase electron transfer subunit [Clostridia bacterium]
MTVTENISIARDIFRLRLSGDTSGIERPGQFVNLQLEGLFLRRPISVCDWDSDTLTLIYKTVGKGTNQMSGLRPGAVLDLLSGLGNGYDTGLSGDHPLLLGGGVGVPPLYALAKQLIHEGKQVQAVLGFRTGADVFGAKELSALGVETTVTTEDGSLGQKGFVTDALPKEYSFFFACGPMPMLKAVWRACPTSGQLSLEERMGCGFGACMGCSIQTLSGPKRICREGPVFRKEDLPWNG